MPSSLNVYSAFGEKIVRPSDTRYGYAGAWGYEDLTATSSPLAANLMHVGFRTYVASTGRFLERDPIGIFGGLNVYEYCFSDPLSYVDPLGFGFWDGKNAFHRAIGKAIAKILGPDRTLKWIPKRYDDPKKTARDAKIAAGVGVVCLGGAGALAVAGISPWVGAIALHGANHIFPIIGSSKHIQIMIRTGIHRTSNIRIPYQWWGL